MPTRFTVAPGGLNFALNLPVLADDTLREVIVMMAKELLPREEGVVCVLLMCERRGWLRLILRDS